MQTHCPSGKNKKKKNLGAAINKEIHALNLLIQHSFFKKLQL